MPNYNYVARDWGGEVQNGIIFAESDQELRALLRQRNLFLTKYTSKADQSERNRSSIFRPRKVKLGDIVVFSRQFATLIRAGLPVVEAMGTLALQTDNPLLSEAVGDVRLDIVAGETLSGAMKKHPKIFSNLYVALVQAGEVGGVLDKTLEIAADQFDKEADLREKVKAAMTYPKLVVLASVGVVAFMIVFIVPTFAKVYAGFNAELPAITLMLLKISDIAVHYGWLVVLLGIASFMGLGKYTNTPKGHMVKDQLTLKIPIVGKVMRKICIARFAETWGGATKGGIPIIEALQVSATTAGNDVIAGAITGMIEDVKGGAPIAPSLDKTGEFPPLVTRMVGAGEKSGNLDFMLEELSKYYKRDVDYAVDKLTKLMEPIMTILVGGIVLFVLLALYMPMFMLTNVLKR